VRSRGGRTHLVELLQLHRALTRLAHALVSGVDATRLKLRATASGTNNHKSDGRALPASSRQSPWPHFRRQPVSRPFTNAAQAQVAADAEEHHRHAPAQGGRHAASGAAGRPRERWRHQIGDDKKTEQLTVMSKLRDEAGVSF
jgi:hypothetical protein